MTPSQSLPRYLEMITLRDIGFLILIMLSMVISEETRIVKTKLGLIRGIAASDGDYFMFMGITYARINKSNPFGESIPDQKFEGIYDANDDSVICIYMNKRTNRIIGQLDCLTLNIYVPKIAHLNNSLPVMYYIYGGNFRTGLAGRVCYGPRFLVRHDIIVVTVNYRSGPYGFFCLDTPEVPGNQGLKDQQTGLKWIYENIEAFGGDPNRITVSGQSSGAISAHYQYYYGEQNFINKIILASGTAFFPNTIQRSDAMLPIRIAQSAGFNTSDLEEALSFLRNLDPKLVIHAENKLNITYRPCIEKDFSNVTNFITQYPINVKQKFKNIPLLIGNTEDESKYLYNIDSSGYDGKDSVILEAINTIYNLNSTELYYYYNLIRQFYKTDGIDLTRANIDFTSDLLWNYPTTRIIKEHMKSGAKVYLYLFTYFGKRNYMNMKLNITGKSTHADEIGYLFDMNLKFINNEYTNPEDQHMLDVFTTIWANFIKFGDPTPEASELLPVKWEPITKDKWYYMNIDSELGLRKRILYRRMAFWDLLYEELAEFERERNNY